MDVATPVDGYSLSWQKISIDFSALDLFNIRYSLLTTLDIIL